MKMTKVIGSLTAACLIAGAASAVTPSLKIWNNEATDAFMQFGQTGGAIVPANAKNFPMTPANVTAEFYVYKPTQNEDVGLCYDAYKAKNISEENDYCAEVKSYRFPHSVLDKGYKHIALSLTGDNLQVTNDPNRQIALPGTVHFINHAS